MKLGMSERIGRGEPQVTCMKQKGEISSRDSKRQKDVNGQPENWCCELTAKGDIKEDSISSQ